MYFLASAWRLTSGQAQNRQELEVGRDSRPDVVDRELDESTKIYIQSSDNDANRNISVVGTNPFCQFPDNTRSSCLE
jgi:hypothetical protein